MLDEQSVQRISFIESQLQNFAVLLAYDGNPNGVLTAREGTLAWDYANNTIYVNVSASEGTAWLQLSPANGSGTPGWYHAGIDGTAVTVTGGVTYGTIFLYIVRAVTAADVKMGTISVEPGGSLLLWTDETTDLTLACSAGGVVTVQRTAGTDTFDVTLMGIWM